MISNIFKHHAQMISKKVINWFKLVRIRAEFSFMVHSNKIDLTSDHFVRIWNIDKLSTTESHKTVLAFLSAFHPLHNMEFPFLLLFVSGSPSQYKTESPGLLRFSLMSAGPDTGSHGSSAMSPSLSSKVQLWL